MLETPLPAEVLPVGVFHPDSNHVFVAQVMLILQVMQRHHQTPRQTRSTLAGMIGRSQSGFELTPGNALPRTSTRVVHVDQLLQVNLEHLSLLLLRLAVWTHSFSPVFRPLPST